MLSNARVCASLVDARVAQKLVMAFAVLVGGCSADVTRFDFPFFGLTDKGGETGSLSTPPDSMARRDPRYDDASGAQQPRGAGLGDAGRGYTPAPYTPAPYSGSSDRLASNRDYAPPPPAADPAPGADRYAGRPMDRPRAAARGETIQVQEGDTLYGISKRYGVSLGALIEINGLGHGSAIKPGQQLVLPAGATASTQPAPEQTAGRAPLARTATPPPQAAAPVATAGWEGRHTLKSGESLYSLARQHGVTLAELQRVNGITEPTRVRAGTVLSVPGAATASAEPAPAAERSPPAVQRPASGPTGTASQPRILNTPPEPKIEQKTASLNDRSNDASAPAAETGSGSVATSGRFRWPARGRVIAAFGKRPDGTHNDGINIAVPQGTDVHAAENGRVAYAGNELKGYGNLVLIRHDNGWVSAYAHADQVLVKRDDVVKRGQVIAKAGKTGTVDQPQLHFELRQGAKPIDPLPHMEK
jgi:murein DD-endopeptidase MepM/ murein hydrolase activator NlpD